MQIAISAGLHRGVMVGVCAFILGGCGSGSGLKTYMNGIEAFKKGHYALAHKNISRALKDRPDQAEDAPAYNYLGLSAFHIGDREDAISAFRKSHQLDETYFDACYNLGVLLCEDGDEDDGPKLLMRAARIKTDDPRPLEWLADFYEHKGAAGEARAMLQVARQRNPDSSRILTRVAVNGLESEGAAFASSYLKEALQKDAEYPVAVFNQAVLHDRWVNDYEGALDFYRRYMEIARGGVHSDKAEIAIARLEQSIARDFQNTVSKKPSPAVYTTDEERLPEIPLKVAPVRPNKVPETPPEVDPASVDGLLKQAHQQLADGQDARALNLCLQAAALASRKNNLEQEEKALRTAVALCVGQPRAHFALGRYLSDEKGDYRQAMRAFERAGEIEPLWEQAHLSMAKAAIACGEFQAALTALRKSVAAAPDEPDPMWALALFYDTQLKLESSAHRSFTRFVVKFPDDPRVEEAQARLKNLRADAPTSPVTVRPFSSSRVTGSNRTNIVSVTVSEPRVTTFKSTKILTPKPPVSSDYRERAEAHFDQGSRYQAQEDFDRAALFYQQAINEDPTYAPPFYNLGLIYQRRNQLEYARNAYERAVSNDPRLVDARYNLALIQRELGEHDTSLNSLRQILNDHPEYANAHLMLGQAFADDPDHRESVRSHYTRFLELAPEDPGAAEVRRWLLRN